MHIGIKGIVTDNGKYNLEDENGKIILNEWYDYISRFSDGFASVGKDGKFNLIDTDIKFVSDVWYDNISIQEFNYKYPFKVQEKGKFNVMNKNNEFLFDEWYDIVRYHEKNDSYIVKKDGEFNIVNQNGKKILGKWYEKINCLSNGYYSLYKFSSFFICDTHGILITENPFYGVCSTMEEKKFFYVEMKYGGYNFVDIYGNLISYENFKYAGHFKEGKALVIRNDGTRGYIDTSGYFRKPNLIERIKEKSL